MPPQPARECGRKHCHVPIPENSKHKNCDRCRELNRTTTHKRRQRTKENISSSLEPPAKSPRLESDGPSSNTFGDDDEDEAGQTSYTSAQSMLSALHEVAKSSPDLIVFHETCSIPAESGISDRERVKMMAKDIWDVTGYRFTVRDNKKLAAGHRTRYFCSQDAERKKQPKPSQKPGVKNREHVGMKRFLCKSSLTMICRRLEHNWQISVKLKHVNNHPHYIDVSMPEGALDLIREHAGWLKPTALVAKVQTAFPMVTATQIHTAWRQMSQVHWKRHDLQVQSAEILLAEYGGSVDILKIDGLPEGVEMLAWGMKEVAGKLSGRAREIAMDATYNTNSKHLELYTIMAECDGAGFPLSYCLLTTATAVEQRKRTKALAEWCRRVRDEYDIRLTFIHIDKDMAEIASCKQVWPQAKISLCLWHLKRAVRTRLSKTKLATTAYHADRAHDEFPFIKRTFKPSGSNTDADDYEGGLPDDHPLESQSVAELDPFAIFIRLPMRAQPVTADISASENSHSQTNTAIDLSFTRQPEAEEQSEGESGSDEAKKRDCRTFCPAHLREEVLMMMEHHFCAHPMIPGYSAPAPAGIRRWAVAQMYRYCEANDLPEVWAYLWENWYRARRWGLWARCAHDEIPVLRTTMMVEAHWSRLKQGFLHQFHMPRCDLLVWILVTQLGPTYHRRLDSLLSGENDVSRYRDPPSWRKAFKKMWRKLETAAVPQPLNDKYKPDAKAWKCTCPSFVINRFLICKHLVQRMRRVPVVFFWEVKRQRTAPYWKHPSLRVIHDDEEDSDDDDDDEGGPGDVEGVAEAGGCALDAEDPADGEDDDEETSDWEQWYRGVVADTKRD